MMTTTTGTPILLQSVKISIYGVNVNTMTTQVELVRDPNNFVLIVI